MDYSTVESYAREAGFAKIGFCSPNSFAMQQSTVNEQPMLHERRQLRFNPEAEYPWVKSLLVMLWPYRQAPVLQDSNQVYIDSYYHASNCAYQAARELEKRLAEAGANVKANVPYPAKAAAVRAGLGIIGDHSLLITPEYGTHVVIILMATDIDIPEKAEVLDKGDCLHCGNCAAACPVEAITKEGMVHPERCLRNYMLEGIVVPEHMREKMGMKLVGCDACQRACPMQVDRGTLRDQPFYLHDFVTTDEERFRKSLMLLGNAIGRNAARPQRVRAQAALLAGNRKDPDVLAVLREWSDSQFEAVKAHATWACAQIEEQMQGLDQCKEKR